MLARRHAFDIFEWDALCCQQRWSIFSLFFSCEVNIGSDMWIAEMHNHRLLWMFSMTCESLWLQCTGTLKSCSNSLYSFCSFLLRTLWKCILFCIRLVKVEILWLQTKLVCTTRKDRREYMWNCCKRGDHPVNNASTYCFACSSNASDTGIRTNQNKFIHTRSDFI